MKFISNMKKQTVGLAPALGPVLSVSTSRVFRPAA